MISKKEVQHIAKLARLSLTPKEAKKMEKELSSVLDYIDKLKEINTDDIQPISQITGLKNVIRNDEKYEKYEVKKERIKIRNKLLKLAPETKDGYLKVKSIIKKTTKNK